MEFFGPVLPQNEYFFSQNNIKTLDSISLTINTNVSIKTTTYSQPFKRLQKDQRIIIVRNYNITFYLANHTPIFT